MKIFISHAVSTDDRLATELRASLLDAGHDVFETSPRGDWRAEISAAIRRSDAVIALLTAPSRNVYFELGVATGANVATLVAASSAEVMPADLSSAPYVRLTGDTTRDVAAVIRRVAEVAEHRWQPTSVAPEAVEDVLAAAARDPSILEQLSPTDFEQLVAHQFRRLGFAVSAPTRTSDVGVDLMLGPDPTIVVEIKRYSRQNLVSVGAVRQLLGALAVIGAERAILVSSSGFTRAAQALAAEAPVELLTIEDLLNDDSQSEVAPGLQGETIETERSSVRSTALPDIHESSSAAKLKPLGDRLIVRAIEEEEVTPSGIVLPDTAKEKPQKGRVLAVGNGKLDDGGRRVPLDIKAGDEVLYSKYGGTEIKIDGEDLLVLRESDVLAKGEK